MEAVEKHFFPKSERLYLQNDIHRLFDSGSYFMAYPLRVLYLPESTVLQPEIEVLISVSKKKFKRAVRRNRVKRLIREAYRLHNGELKSSVFQNAKRLHIAFVYVSNELPVFKEVETGMIKAMKMLENKIIK